MYEDLPKEFSGGIIGLNIFSGSLGMLSISKLSVVLNDYFSKNVVYGVGVLLMLNYLIIYLLFLYVKEAKIGSTLKLND